MSGFAGICNLKQDISNEKETIKQMNLKLSKENSEENYYFLDKNINLSSSIQKDKDRNETIESIKLNDITYTIIHNGKIYNKEEIKEKLINLGYSFEGNSDTEILLKAYIEYGENILKKLNGVFSFAIWNDKKQELFLARDHFGIKPLYYTIIDGELVFSTQIKAILSYPKVNAKLDKTGIAELFGLRASTHTRFNSI